MSLSTGGSQIVNTGTSAGWAMRWLIGITPETRRQGDRGTRRRVFPWLLLVTPSPCLLVKSRAGVTDLRELALNERQIEALRLMVNEGREMTNTIYQELFGISRRTATRDLRALVRTGWVRQKGTRKGTRYVAERGGA